MSIILKIKEKRVNTNCTRQNTNGYREVINEKNYALKKNEISSIDVV